MKLRAGTVAVAALTVACAGEVVEEEVADDARLQVERVTEGDVTVIRNLSGSRWGGNATLEMVLEIGVDEGDDRYMFNSPWPFSMTDEEIYLLEARDGRVRVYGLDGEHHRDFGEPGQGPGQLERARHMSITPDGRVAVTSTAGAAARTAFFTPEGEFIEEWRTREAPPGDGVMVVPFLVMALRDTVLVSVYGGMGTQRSVTSWRRQLGTVVFGPDGYEGKPWFAPQLVQAPATYRVTRRGRTSDVPVPWSVSRALLAALPDGSVLWAHGDRYRFHIVAPDGSTTAIERVTAPVPIDPNEAEWARRMIEIDQRAQAPDFSWDGEGMPATKPRIRSFVDDHSGWIWVSREGRGRRVDPCHESRDSMSPGEPYIRCWQSEPLLDIFDRSTGEFLGSLDRPEGLSLFGPFVRGNLMVAGYEDEFGISKVRLYRLVLPSGAENDPAN